MEKLLISACLYGEKCRYDAKDNLLPCLDLLKERFILIPVCPEVTGGLETPRKPSEITGGKVVMNDGRDVTREYEKGALAALEAALKNGCRIALMKAKSPSCGSGRIYDGTFSKVLTDGDGITSALLKKNGIKVFDETQIFELLEYIKA